jgi:phosphomannomutase
MDRLMVSVSGVRGTVGGTLTPRVACDFGCAYAAMLGAGKTVTVGRDSRTSGPMIRGALVSGLLAGGVGVVDLGVASTPVCAWMTRRLGADGGVIITASHNPAQYNGMKFLQPIGTGLVAADAERLKEIWQAGRFSLADHSAQGRECFDPSGPAGHVQAVLEQCDTGAIAGKRFKVVVDSVNGAGGPEARLLMDNLGCKLTHLNAEPTGLFAHNPEPVAENLGALCQAVRENRAAAGFAQDADADRLAIVDESGTFIGEEYTLALCAAFVLHGRKGPLATNLATSRMIDDVAARAGQKVLRAPTGEANVVDAMRAGGCIFGGEGGGGVIDPRVVLVRNSFVGMAMVLQYLTETGKPLSELVAEIPRYVMLKTKMPCSAEAAGKVVARAKAVFATRHGATMNDSDGLRIDLPGRWVCVRASNTEPIMRIIAEAPDQAAAEALVAEVRKLADEAMARE